MKRIGPFTQLLTMEKIPQRGALNDSALEVVCDAGILVEGETIVAVGRYDELRGDEQIRFETPRVALPGIIDSHTHLCWGGSRARDYALRVQGISYQEIGRLGGGILETVAATRQASSAQLIDTVIRHLDRQQAWGITTCEVKSGYGLSVEGERHMLQAILQGASRHAVSVVPTCLAAHALPPEFSDRKAYLAHIQSHLLPLLKPEINRVDIFVEEGAFSPEEALPYLRAAKKMGLAVVVHANQFSHLGVAAACEAGAVSADHLEQLTEVEMRQLLSSDVIATALPGAALGLGVGMPPVRKMLDAGLCVAIASDWNPGSAPMGNLIAQAAILGAAEKLSLAETLAGMTVRAAAALQLSDRGVIAAGKRCDLTLFETKDWRDILYYQGSMPPSETIIQGEIFPHVDRTHR